MNRGWRFCSAQRRPKTKGTLRVLLSFSRRTWLTLGWFLLTTAQDWAQSWAQPPRAHPCLCAHATDVGSCCACTSTAAASATRMGDDRSIAHGHGLSSDDYDDAGVDSDLPLAGRGNNGRPRTESDSGDPVAGIAPSTSSQRALQTVLDWSPRLSYTVDRREASPGNVICEGETHGFETT